MSGLRCIAVWWTCCLAAATAAAAEIDLGSGFVRSAAWEKQGQVRTVDPLTQHYGPGTPLRRAPLPRALMPTLRPVPEPGSPPGPPPEHPVLPAERCGPANPPPRL